MFDEIIEQPAAKRLFTAAIDEGPVHAYLFHGPPGVGKQKTALAFAAHLLGDRGRVERRAHPDLYVLEPLGDQIRIDEVRKLRRDLHMRPFEAERRVYVVVSAHTLNDEASDALLKDLEEPPQYAVICLLADEVGPVPLTIRSRCQLVPFSRLSEKAVHTVLAAQAPGLPPERDRRRSHGWQGVVWTGPSGCSTRMRPSGEMRSSASRALSTPTPGSRPRRPPQPSSGLPTRLGSEARAKADDESEWLGLPERENEQRLRRAEFGAMRESVLEALEELTAWYRDLVTVAVGAEPIVVHYDHLATLREDGVPERLPAAERSAELVREAWRWFEELNLQPKLALEALFIRLRRELAPA